MDQYDNPGDRARQLNSAIKRGISVEAWLAHIDRLRRQVSKNQSKQRFIEIDGAIRIPDNVSPDEF